MNYFASGNFVAFAKQKTVFITRTLLAAVLAVSMSGCLLTSPFWGQEFSTHTEAIPLQAWTSNKTAAITFECATAFHGGLYPPFGTPTWIPVANIMPSQNPSYDSLGTAIYSAGVKMALPSSCWRMDTNNSWYTSIRATQITTSGTTVYRVFDQAGLSCLGASIGSSGSWLGWTGCPLTYSNSSNAVPYVIFWART